MNDVIAWAAPIASTLIICAGQAALNERFKIADEKRDNDRKSTEEKRKAEAEWRDDVTKRLDTQDRRIETILTAQCAQMRSDIIHKCHRYLDDLGKASTEEKRALDAEHQEYTSLCEQNDIVNNFVDGLVKRVMQLPERSIDG
jgi:hypothetical protein